MHSMFDDVMCSITLFAVGTHERQKQKKPLMMNWTSQEGRRIILYDNYLITPDDRDPMVLTG